MNRLAITEHQQSKSVQLTAEVQSFAHFLGWQCEWCLNEMEQTVGAVTINNTKAVFASIVTLLSSPGTTEFDYWGQNLGLEASPALMT